MAKENQINFPHLQDQTQIKAQHNYEIVIFLMINSIS